MSTETVKYVIESIQDGKWIPYGTYYDVGFSGAIEHLQLISNRHSETDWRLSEVKTTIFAEIKGKKSLDKEKLLKLLKGENNSFIYDDKVFCVREINELEGSFKLQHKDYSYFLKFEDIEIGNYWIKSKEFWNQRVFTVYTKLS